MLPCTYATNGLRVCNSLPSIGKAEPFKDASASSMAREWAALQATHGSISLSKMETLYNHGITYIKSHAAAVNTAYESITQAGGMCFLILTMLAFASKTTNGKVAAATRIWTDLVKNSKKPNASDHGYMDWLVPLMFGCAKSGGGDTPQAFACLLDAVKRDGAALRGMSHYRTFDAMVAQFAKYADAYNTAFGLSKKDEKEAPK